MLDNFLEISFPFKSDYYNESSQKIIELINENKSITTEDMAIHIGISRRAIAKQITKLKEEGIIEHIGPDKGGYWNLLK